MNDLLDYQYNLIHRYFITTTEPYDELDWDGESLAVILADEVIETYTLADLRLLIPNFEEVTNEDICE